MDFIISQFINNAYIFYLPNYIIPSDALIIQNVKRIAFEKNNTLLAKLLLRKIILVSFSEKFLFQKKCQNH